MLEKSNEEKLADLLLSYTSEEYNMPLNNAFALTNNGYGPITSDMVSNCYDILNDELALCEGGGYEGELLTTLMKVIPIPNVLIENVIDRVLLTRAINEIFLLIGSNETSEESIEELKHYLFIESHSGKYDDTTTHLINTPEFEDSVLKMFTLFRLINLTTTNLWTGVTIGYLDERMVIML